MAPRRFLRRRCLTIEARFIAQVTDAVQAASLLPTFARMPSTRRSTRIPRFAAHYKDSGKPAAAQAFATLIEGMDKSLGDILDHLVSPQAFPRTR